MTLEEIRAYYSGDAIVCMRCGKSYRNLGVHLKAIHAMTVDDYKEMYGLPWSRGLSCDESRILRRDGLLARLDVGELTELAAAARKKKTGKERQRQPFRNEISMMNLKIGPKS